MLHAFYVVFACVVVVGVIFSGIHYFSKLILDDRVIEALAVAIAAVIACVGVIQMLSNATKPTIEISSTDDCQTQLEWINKHIQYYMSFRTKNGDYVSHNIIIRIDGTAATEYQVSANTECNAIKKVTPIASAYFEAQKQVEEEE